nr:T9SS type A sorting domain-containing protein [Bacteroidia bacterium]
DSLQTTEYYVQNEQWMNTQYLTAYSVANYNPNAEIQEQIKTLAYACPYLEGKAVFKARTLNSLLNPLANYDDLELCNNAGVNKAGDAKGLFDQENEGLDSMANADGLQLIYAKEKRGIKIFPNPAQEKISIKYQLNRNESAVLILYDLTGRERKQIQLISSSTVVETTIAELNDGIYTYKYFVNSTLSETGKLSVIK